ncbi:MAG: peptidoglycan bridge formation glycyltransferase FemA/FemB family protein [Rhodospirillales bacterium]|nr:peptidoglycan bridge formation glycyltransferase FemA/FemB family protein [Rhodospirillales bacterium]MCB9997261.1 peptidoglycan bridge formation glycyltransferase FemA/FemB family protein [Rhodospirillales bacterium]
MDSNQCKIEWNGLALEAWEARFAKLKRATLLQSYDYARAACPLYRQKARWGLIYIDEAEAGLVQVMEAGLPGNIIHAVMLDRGPLWFDGFGAPAHMAAFFAAFNREFPARFGRRRRVIPETADAALLLESGFRRLERPGYQTVWVDLQQDEQALRAAMKPQWRNKVNKGEKAGLQIEWDETGETLPELLTIYQSDKSTKGYDGPSVKLLRAMAKTFIPQGRFLAGRTVLDNQPIAAILILCHGSAATYQVGWSSEDGRKTAAHNHLLWQAACRLKDKGIKDFDLGGVNDDADNPGAKGIKQFKEGMGGQTLTYAGHFF